MSNELGPSGWFTAHWKERQVVFATGTAIEEGSVEFLRAMNEGDNLTETFLRLLGLKSLSKAKFVEFNMEKSLISSSKAK
jgi:hypothetical protein